MTCSDIIFVPGLAHQDFVFARQQHDLFVAGQLFDEADILAVHPYPGRFLRFVVGHEL